jgi:hypothetical protein
MAVMYTPLGYREGVGYLLSGNGSGAVAHAEDALKGYRFSQALKDVEEAWTRKFV